MVTVLVIRAVDGTVVLLELMTIVITMAWVLITIIIGLMSKPFYLRRDCC